MVNSTLRLVVVYFGPLSIFAITLLREGRADLCAFVVSFVLRVLYESRFSSSWCQGLGATCDCGTLWIFVLPVCLTDA